MSAAEPSWYPPRVIETAKLLLGMAPADVAEMLPDELTARVEGHLSLLRWWVDTAERISRGVAPKLRLAMLVARLTMSPDPLDRERLELYQALCRLAEKAPKAAS